MAPPGGHVDPDEDPVQATAREVLDERGIAAEVVPHAPLRDDTVVGNWYRRRRFTFTTAH